MGRLKILLAVLYLLGAFCWSIPSTVFPQREPVVAAFNPVFQFVGLWQGWNMFAPDPIKDDIYVSVTATFADGASASHHVSRMNHMGYGTRYARERWRKFFNDRLRLDANSHLWPNAARWFAKEYERLESKPVTKIDLIRHWHPVAVPENGVVAPRPDWRSYVFYTATFEPAT